MKRLVCLAGLILLPATALPAQTPPTPADPNTLSLSDEQKADLLAHNTEDSVDAARAGLGTGAPSRQIHGEIGAMVGTHGTRGVYGTAAIPLGDNAGATVSFENSRYGYGRHQ
jgi:hypothetical protein